MSNKTMQEVDTITIKDLSELSYIRLTRKTKIIVESQKYEANFDRSCCRNPENIAGIFIRNSGKQHSSYSHSSDDGSMLFFVCGKEKSLAMYVGDEKNPIIPDGITVIGSRAFESTKIESVVMPDSVEKIESCAFAGCENLKSVRFSKNLRKIGEAAFFRSGIESLNFPPSLTTISNEAFYYCEKLQPLTFPDGLKKIGNRAFYGCKKLTDIRIPSSVQEIGMENFVYANRIHISNIPDGFLDALRDSSENSECFLVYYNDCRFLFPRYISYKRVRETEEFMRTQNAVSGQKYYVGFEFAVVAEEMTQLAYDGFRMFKDRQSKEYLRHHYLDALFHISKKGESQFLEFLSVLQDGNIISEDIIWRALDISADKKWIRSTAFVLNMNLKNSKSKPNFDI